MDLVLYRLNISGLTISSVLIALFGTVLGIIAAFHDLAVNTAEASEAVMAGISEALVATAVGLAVALPAVSWDQVRRRGRASRVRGRRGRSTGRTSRR